MSELYEWAAAHGVSLAAVQDLQRRLGLLTIPEAATSSGPAKSEAWAQSAVRLEAGQKGVRLWRNNVGALQDKTGRLVRYGLANDSAELNDKLKSPDLVGWRPVVIQPHMVGQKLAKIVLREVKEPGWQYTATDHERAQWAFLRLALADGADAQFCTGPGTL